MFWKFIRNIFLPLEYSNKIELFIAGLLIELPEIVDFGTFDLMKSELSIVERKYLSKLIDRIVELRKARGLSQEKLAVQSEIARSLMRGYERKERNISYANLVRIIHFGLEMKIEEFFSEGFDVEKKKKNRNSN